MNRSEMLVQIDQLLNLGESLSGHLRKREVQFLATLPFLEAQGDILEIGSFKGKSTIILAKAAIAAGMDTISACDPLSLSCETDPDDAVKEELPQMFYDNLTQYDVKDNVRFYQMRSDHLAPEWKNPLKILWIDGDHTYPGALADFSLFKPHLVPGAIVCLHDVLHGFDGPIRVFMEKILLSDCFGNCGICGSIGWGQFTSQRPILHNQWKNKLSLYAKLARLLPGVIQSNLGQPVNKYRKKLLKALIPHGPISPPLWLEEQNQFFSTRVD
ncbi:MAG: class I SAM-dependent methyltransferase [Desulfobacter sp.]